MKIICLCKLKPQSRDLYKSPYGRFFHLSKGLAEKGHEVHLVLLNYNNGPELEDFKNGMYWHSFNLIPNPFKYYLKSLRLAKSLKADWIIGFSDTYFGIMASLIAEKTGAHSMIDAYDNFESYVPWCTPLHKIWRKHLSEATILTAAGPNLLEKMQTGRKSAYRTHDFVISMSADEQFTPGNKETARKAFQLPLKKKIIGYIGSLHKNRGVEFLPDVIEKILKNNPDTLFLYSGRNPLKLRFPKGTINLGYISHDKLNLLYQSIDLLLAINIENDFGNYSYPVKIYEALATDTCVIASKTKSTEYVLSNNPKALVKACDPDELFHKLQEFINNPWSIEPVKSGWEEQSSILAKKLECIYNS